MLTWQPSTADDICLLTGSRRFHPRSGVDGVAKQTVPRHPETNDTGNTRSCRQETVRDYKASGVKPHLKLLALVIPYSGIHKARYDIVFSYGTLYINKKQFCYPCFLLTSKGDFGVKAPPQTCQQSIFGILMAPQINPWGQTFWPS